MSKLIKTACCTLVAGLAAAVFFYSDTGRINSLFEGAPTSQQGESDRIDAFRMETIKRVENTDLLVLALMEGRSSLDEAAREFIRIHGETPSFQFQHPILTNSGSLLESASRDLATRA